MGDKAGGWSWAQMAEGLDAESESLGCIPKAREGSQGRKGLRDWNSLWVGRRPQVDIPVGPRGLKTFKERGD